MSVIIFGPETNQQIVPAIKIVLTIKSDPTCVPDQTAPNFCHKFVSFVKPPLIFSEAAGWAHMRPFSSIKMHYVAIYVTFYNDLCFAL